MRTTSLSYIAISALAAGLFGQTQPSQNITAAMVEQWMKDLSNWGRWGAQDQLGAVNLITSAKRKQAAALVKDGVTVSLAHNTETEKAADNDSPFGHTMTSTGRS